ncbi:hypothetical protein Poli38472_006184 [Pythium oligandrum]|uniref:PPIase cyclophilin-type domain-containing protein n=1 Tax=Pythium oligandrum TaxID=41045 RepID=A0A8K1FMW4_PYTOL|nr:hypothetical protein Poli38472_006184 [Pythium oligandrum]|eukprot:TMW68716.1 hypothetical protein Poli38472_006184 [Pythium oligandrum]
MMMTDMEKPGPFNAPRHRVPRASTHTASRGSGVLRAPLFLAVVALFGLGIGYHVYNFSVGLPQYAPLHEPFYNKTMVEFTTPMGAFTVELFPEHAPKTVETFLKLIDSGYYTDRAGFYRNEPKFLLQGGGYLYDKVSPFPNLPVEYSLPSEERNLVIARSHKSDSGNAEFAIMLHDNTEHNKPTEDSPGYTAFGRVVQGWHTIETISRKMRDGYLAKEDRDRQVVFEKVEYVSRITNDNHEAKKRLEELNYVLETKHTVNILSELDCAETKELKALFTKMKATVRVEEVGYSLAHPYEHEAIEALSGTTKLPLVYINHKLIGGLTEVKALQDTQRLSGLLARGGTQAEDTVWTAIHQYPLVIFSKSYCPYCKKAKEILASLGAQPKVFELDLREDGAAIQDFLLSFTGQGTVPNVFIKAKSIGGSDKTAAMYKSGELKDRLKRAGAIA